MSVKVSDFILARLREWDIDHVFAYAGDGINGLLAAWGRAGNTPDVRSGSAILHGDSDRTGMIRQGAKAKLQEFLPGGPSKDSGDLAGD